MNKKIIGTSLLLVGVLSGCSAPVNYQGNLLRSPGAKIEVSNDVITSPEYRTYLNKLSQFSARFSDEFVQSFAIPSENIALSPFSIYMALAMAAECAGHNTKQEIYEALNMSQAEVETYTKVLYALSNKEYSARQENDQNVTVAREESTNSLWFQKDLPLKDEGLDRLAEDYYCYPFGVDFQRENTKVNRQIQEFIKEKTHDIINRNFAIPQSTLLAIINTLYLKEVWNAEGLDMGFTNNNYHFKNANGTMTNTKLLNGYYVDGRAYEEETFTHFMAKTAHNYKIKFIVPKDGHTVKEVFTAANIQLINTMKDYRSVDEENKILYYTSPKFPEFKASSLKYVEGILDEKFGIHDLFIPGKCDFSNISTASLYCDSIIHNADLTVDKTGIEGAAVTILLDVGNTQPDEEYEKVYLDYEVTRSFGYLITDPFDVPLFSGVINQIS